MGCSPPRPEPGAVPDCEVSSSHAANALTNASGSPKLEAFMASNSCAGPPNSSNRQAAPSLKSGGNPNLGAKVSHSSSFMHTTETLSAAILSAREFFGGNPGDGWSQQTAQINRYESLPYAR